MIVRPPKSLILSSLSKETESLIKIFIICSSDYSCTIRSTV